MSDGGDSSGRALSALERRLSRIAIVAPALAVIAAVFGMLPNGVDLLHHSFKHDTDIWTGRTTHAGGWALVGWALLQVWVGNYVRAEPSRRAGMRWIVLSLCIDVVGAVAWLFENFTFDTEVPRWPGQVTATCVGAATVLVFLIVPLVLVVSDRSRPSEAQRARVVRR